MWLGEKSLVGQSSPMDGGSVHQVVEVEANKQNQQTDRKFGLVWPYRIVQFL